MSLCLFLISEREERSVVNGVEGLRALGWREKMLVLLVD
jgi:hypothetical protein